MRRRTLVAVMVSALILLVWSAPGQAAPHLQGRAVITYPTNGATLGGVVDVVGIASHPNLNFFSG